MASPDEILEKLNLVDSPETQQIRNQVVNQIIKEALEDQENQGEVALYIVLTECFETEPSKKIVTNDYRVLATSVIEAAQIVQKSLVVGVETVTDVRKASHITGLPDNKFKVVRV